MSPHYRSKSATSVGGKGVSVNGEGLNGNASKASNKFLIPIGLPPGFTGVFSAAGGHWSEAEQKKLNDFFRHWLDMLKAEMAEKQRTIIEIAERLDLNDEEIADRVSSEDYQSLLRKGFRDWSGTKASRSAFWSETFCPTLGLLASSATTSCDSLWNG